MNSPDPEIVWPLPGHLFKQVSCPFFFSFSICSPHLFIALKSHTLDLWLKIARLAFRTEEHIEGRMQLVFYFYRPVTKTMIHTHTHRATTHRSTVLRFVKLCLLQQFCNYSNCFSNPSVCFFLFTPPPLLWFCRSSGSAATLYVESWFEQNDDSL